MDITISENKPTMTSLEIAGLVESRHDSVKRTIERLANQAVISLPPLVEVKVQRKRREETVSAYRFTDEQGKRDSIVVVAQLSPEFTARLVDRWQELEKKLQSPYGMVPKSFSEALRLAADLAEKNELLQLERDEAIRTKAQIGSRREATAMATASAEARRAARLEIEMDKSTQYATIKRMQMIYHGQRFDWRILKSTGIEMGIEPIDVFDANYGTVKAYHADVWKEAYALDIQN